MLLKSDETSETALLRLQVYIMTWRRALQQLSQTPQTLKTQYTQEALPTYFGRLRSSRGAARPLCAGQPERSSRAR